MRSYMQMRESYLHIEHKIQITLKDESFNCFPHGNGSSHPGMDIIPNYNYVLYYQTTGQQLAPYQAFYLARSVSGTGTVVLIVLS